MAESSREAGLLIERVAYAALAQTPDAQGAVEAFVVGSGSSDASGGGSRPDPRRRHRRRRRRSCP